ncbi:MAG: caspase family protein [Syntrophaceae bacterium]|nr:caspase family protein [Syntrophaceae bacterium]
MKVFPAPPNLTAVVNFSEPSGNNILDAEETGKLILTLKNDGRGDAFDVRAEISVDKGIQGLRFEKNVLLGTIPAGKSVAWEIPVRADEGIPTADLRFTIDIKEANGFDPDPVRIVFKTKSFEPPRLVLADMGIEDQNKNSRVEPMEIVEVTARIQNVGHGDARAVSVDLEIGPNVFLAGEAVTRFDLGSLPSGKFKDVKFAFYTNRRIPDGEKIPISLKINEARPQFRVAKGLDLRMNAPQRRTEEIVIAGAEEKPKGAILVAAGLSVDVDMNIPEGRKAGPNDIAVVIGNKSYSAPGIPSVEFADRDGVIMREYLLRTFGFKPENIIYVENATLAQFNNIFGSETHHQGQLFNWVKEGVSEVFIYYVGHGAPDLKSQEAHFVPVDGNPQYIATNGYRLQTLYKNLSMLPAKKITLVVDACFSGNSDRGLLFKDISPAMIRVKKEYAGPANASIITSAAVDQVSAWYPEKRHSLFTYFFLKGLQGEADANKDKRITVGEMKAYLKEHVPYMARRLKSVEQHPVVQGNESDVLVMLK